MAREIERRTFTRDAAPKVDSEGRMHGKAAPFNSPTMIGKAPWGFREKIRPGSWAKSIKDGDVVLLDNHDTAKPIARMSAGTLRLEERGDGAYWDADPVDTTYSRDSQKNIDAGNYGGCSFGFEVIKDKWTTGEDGIDERELIEVKVHEISNVTFPAYSDTVVSMRDVAHAARETAPEGFRDSTSDAEGHEIPLDEQAADLIRQYNELPADLRALVFAAVEASGTETPESEPDTSTREDEARRDALRYAGYRELSRKPTA